MIPILQNDYGILDFRAHLCLILSGSFIGFLFYLVRAFFEFSFLKVRARLFGRRPFQNASVRFPIKLQSLRILWLLLTISKPDCLHWCICKGANRSPRSFFLSIYFFSIAEIIHSFVTPQFRPCQIAGQASSVPATPLLMSSSRFMLYNPLYFTSYALILQRLDPEHAAITFDMGPDFSTRPLEDPALVGKGIAHPSGWAPVFIASEPSSPRSNSVRISMDRSHDTSLLGHRYLNKRGPSSRRPHLFGLHFYCVGTFIPNWQFSSLGPSKCDSCFMTRGCNRN